MTRKTSTPFPAKQRLKTPKPLRHCFVELQRRGLLTADERRTLLEDFAAAAMGYVFEWGIITEEPAESPVSSAKTGPSVEWDFYPTTYIDCALMFGRYIDDARSPFRALALQCIKKACGDLVTEVPYDGSSQLAVSFADADRAKVVSLFQTAILPQFPAIIVKSNCRLMDEEILGVEERIPGGPFAHETRIA